MSYVDTLIATALPAPLRANFGDDATYTPPAGGAVSTWIMLNQGGDLVSEYGETFEPRQTALLPKSDVALPVIGAALAVGTTTYRIDQIIAHDDLFHAVALSVS